MSRALSKRLAAMEAERIVEPERPSVVCIPVSDTFKAKGEEVAPGVWFQSEPYYSGRSIHYEDMAELEKWLALPEQKNLRVLIYRIEELQEIIAELDAEC